MAKINLIEKPYALFILDPKVLDRIYSIFDKKSIIIANKDWAKSTGEDWLNESLLYDLQLNLKGNYSIDDMVNSTAYEGMSIEDYANDHASNVQFLSDSFHDLKLAFPMINNIVENLVNNEFVKLGVEL